VLAIVPGWLSVRCEIADPLLLVLSCAQPVVFVCCVYHVCFLLLGTQRTLQSPFASSDTCNYTRVGLMLSTGNAGQPCMWESVASAFFCVSSERSPYSDRGCCSPSSRMSSAMVLMISDCTPAMSRYTRCRSGSEAYSSCANNSHRFRVSLSSCSRSSNTA
jgi:hypothetical protein